MKNVKKIYKLLIVALLLIFMTEKTQAQNSDYIKWVDFNIPGKALHKAMKIDMETYHTPQHINWVELLAMTRAQNTGGTGTDINPVIWKISPGSSKREKAKRKFLRGMKILIIS